MKRKFLVFVYAFTFIFTIVGSTFAYFAASTTASGNVELAAANFGISLIATPLYSGKAIIPTNDSDIILAYENECVDSLGNGACYAYTVKVENTGMVDEYEGIINFNLDGISNLKYLVLDEDDHEYVSATSIVAETDLSLGETFTLNEEESKTFKVIIWLSNLDIAQDDDDADGRFSASVTYRSTNNGGKVTGIFSA